MMAAFILIGGHAEVLTAPLHKKTGCGPVSIHWGVSSTYYLSARRKYIAISPVAIKTPAMTSVACTFSFFNNFFIPKGFKIRNHYGIQEG
jgi:hypothetical protein